MPRVSVSDVTQRDRAVLNRPARPCSGSLPVHRGQVDFFVPRHRLGNKAARSSAVDIFSLFSTLLTSITSEAAVSLNEN